MYCRDSSVRLLCLVGDEYQPYRFLVGLRVTRSGEEVNTASFFLQELFDNFCIWTVWPQKISFSREHDILQNLGKKVSIPNLLLVKERTDFNKLWTTWRSRGEKIEYRSQGGSVLGLTRCIMTRSNAVPPVSLTLRVFPRKRYAGSRRSPVRF